MICLIEVMQAEENHDDLRAQCQTTAVPLYLRSDKVESGSKRKIKDGLNVSAFGIGLQLHYGLYFQLT